MQLNVMSARMVSFLAGDPDARPLAGDQLYLDFDLSHATCPAGTRLAIGDAVIEVTAQPHTGCAKFIERFGVDAMRFVNGPVGRPAAAARPQRARGRGGRRAARRRGQEGRRSQRLRDSRTRNPLALASRRVG